MRPGLADPFSKEEILNATAEAFADHIRFFESLAPHRFFKKPAKGWSAARNVRHLVKSNGATSLAMRLPKIQFLLFGRAKNGSRRLSDVQSIYLGELERGASAGIYAPVRDDSEGSDAERQRDLIAKLRASGETFGKVLGKSWSEEQLERYRVPHPVMGLITIRELCLFTLLHGYHHRGKVEARVESGEI